MQGIKSLVLGEETDVQKAWCCFLLQFLSLPVVATSAIEKMRVSRGPEIERFLVHSQAFTAGESGFKAENISGMEKTREEAFCIYSRVRFGKSC